MNDQTLTDAMAEVAEAAQLAKWCAEAFKGKLTDAEAFQLNRVWEFADAAKNILTEASSQLVTLADPFQSRVRPWMLACFGEEVSGDKLERGDRLLEEVLELLQSGDYPKERVAALTGYVWSRPVGEPAQEVGGVMVTLAAYCLAHELDMREAAETELARIWTKVEKIRAKQAAKPKGSALPQEWPDPLADRDAAVGAALAEAEDAIADYPRSSPDYDEWTRYDEQIAHSQAILRTIRPDATAALKRALTRAREVKPLVWVKHPAAEIWRCDTMLGTYKIFGIGQFPTWDFDSATDPKDATSKRAENHEAAKSAAQADYAARITAALQPMGDGQ